MEKFQYISVNNILAKFHRDFRGLDVNESDAIEWAGEALGFMKIASAQKEFVCFAEVKNHEVQLPTGLHYVIQVARNTTFVPEKPVTANELICNLDEETEEETTTNVPVVLDCQGKIVGDYDVAYYRPFFNLQYEYTGWRNSTYCQEEYEPVRLANHSFFNSLVCQDPQDAAVYRNNNMYEEYTLIEGNTLRFSFKEGFVAIAYLGQKIDNEGYPMIPDDEYARNAITYYLTWKFKQRECFMHREGACQLSDRAEAQWNKYIKRFKNKAKMPHGLDQYQNLAESSRYLIPRHNRFYGFFGNLGKMEDRRFNHPNRNHNLYIGN